MTRTDSTMTWIARQLAPWLAWFAGREYRRQIERERRQRPAEWQADMQEGV